MRKVINNYYYKVFNSFDDNMTNQWLEFEKKSISTIFQKFFLFTIGTKQLIKNTNISCL